MSGWKNKKFEDRCVAQARACDLSRAADAFAFAYRDLPEDQKKVLDKRLVALVMAFPPAMQHVALVFVESLRESAPPAPVTPAKL